MLPQKGNDDFDANGLFASSTENTQVMKIMKKMRGLGSHT